MDKNILIINSHDLETHFESNNQSEITFNVESFIGDFNEDSNDLLGILKEPYLPQKGDKIYFLPSVSVPRVKFKNVSLEYGVKTVRDPQQANVFIGCSKSVHAMTTNTWAHKARVSDFLAFIEMIEHRLDNHTKDVINTALEFYEKEYIGVSWNIMNCMVSVVAEADVSRYSQRIVYIPDDFKEEFLKLQSVKIYDESSVIDILNGEEAAVIDKDMYEHIADMFRSSDRDNWVLAMEIMANSKYTESLIYLELLFYNFASNIMDMHTKNHVNFKSLISYLDKNMRYLGTDIDDIAKSLINKDQFTPDKMEILMEYLSSDIQRSGNTQFFTVKTITVHPDYIAKLGTNYTYQVQDDYIGPETPVELDDEEERVLLPKDEIVLIEEENAHIDEVVSILDNEDIEVTIETEPESNNTQINTNEPTDIDWF
jgi:hypothetical protein